MTPIIYSLDSFAVLGETSQHARLASARPIDEALDRRIVAGRLFNAPDERGLVVSELLAYRLGCVDEADVGRLLGRPRTPGIRPPGLRAGHPSYPEEGAGAPTRDEIDAIQKIKQTLPDALDQAWSRRPRKSRR